LIFWSGLSLPSRYDGDKEGEGGGGRDPIRLKAAQKESSSMKLTNPPPSQNNNDNNNGTDSLVCDKSERTPKKTLPKLLP